MTNYFWLSCTFFPRQNPPCTEKSAKPQLQWDPFIAHNRTKLLDFVSLFYDRWLNAVCIRSILSQEQDKSSDIEEQRWLQIKQYTSSNGGRGAEPTGTSYNMSIRLFIMLSALSLKGFLCPWHMFTILSSSHTFIFTMVTYFLRWTLLKFFSSFPDEQSQQKVRQLDRITAQWLIHQMKLRARYCGNFERVLCWKHCKYKEWVSFFLGSWGMNRSAEQTNRPRTTSRFTWFVCPVLRFIPHEPRKKDTHSLSECHILLSKLLQVAYVLFKL